MLNLLLLVIAAGLAPLVLAAIKLKPGCADSGVLAPLGSVILAALAFNLTFFWQELWLAIPKALTPGLHPVLYHNDHEWTGNSPITELLQGTGAIATMASGLLFTAILSHGSRLSPTWQAFVFWMAFQGLFQSLTQFAIGAVVPGNDVGRALAYSGFTVIADIILLVATVAAMAFAGRSLAARVPAGAISRNAYGTRRSMLSLCATVSALIVLSVPFRLPRNVTEVLLIPTIVNLIGLAWLLLGMTSVTQVAAKTDGRPPAVFLPVCMLLALLIVFQCVLRAGIPI